MKIHSLFEEYYNKAEEHSTCDACKRGWCQWVSCSPRHSCLNDNIMPCKWCGFWTGYGMTEYEIEYFCKRLEYING